MTFSYSQRLEALPQYAFAEVKELVASLKGRGIQPIDFGVGDPKDPTPDFIRKACQQAVDRHAKTGYPGYTGSFAFRQAAADWMKRRFGVSLDPETEICSSIGSKEAIFHFPLAFINPGDVVIVPSPGYPPMKTGTWLAGGIPYFVPLLAENNFLIDFERIPLEIARSAKILWLNYPNSPTGATADRDYYERLIDWAHRHDIILAADEGCYIDIYFDEKPLSILDVGREGIITFYSLSKRSNMTGYRVGFVAGDERLVSGFKRLKTHIDSGTPDFIQDAAIAALEDEAHSEVLRELYLKKRDLLVEPLSSCGLEVAPPSSTFYLWQKTPNGVSSVDFAKTLLQDELALVVTPGAWISDFCEGGINPGEGYVRFALVPTMEEVEEAVRRLKQRKF